VGLRLFVAMVRPCAASIRFDTELYLWLPETELKKILTKPNSAWRGRATCHPTNSTIGYLSPAEFERKVVRSHPQQRKKQWDQWSKLMKSKLGPMIAIPSDLWLNHHLLSVRPQRNSRRLGRCNAI
jgi:hypothetical protein